MCFVSRYGLIMRLFADCYTFWLPFCDCYFSFYYGSLFVGGRPYSACTVLTRSCQFVTLSPALASSSNVNQVVLKQWNKSLATVKLYAKLFH